MIVDALLRWSLAVLGTMFSWLPEWNWQPAAFDTFGNLNTELAKWDALVPITDVMACGGLILAYWGVMVGGKGIKQIIDWIFDIIP